MQATFSEGREFLETRAYLNEIGAELQGGAGVAAGAAGGGADIPYYEPVHNHPDGGRLDTLMVEWVPNPHTYEALFERPDATESEQTLEGIVEALHAYGELAGVKQSVGLPIVAARFVHEEDAARAHFGIGTSKRYHALRVSLRGAAEPGGGDGGDDPELHAKLAAAAAASELANSKRAGAVALGSKVLAAKKELTKEEEMLCAVLGDMERVVFKDMGDEALRSEVVRLQLAGADSAARRAKEAAWDEREAEEAAAAVRAEQDAEEAVEDAAEAEAAAAAGADGAGPGSRPGAAQPPEAVALRYKHAAEQVPFLLFSSASLIPLCSCSALTLLLLSAPSRARARRGAAPAAGGRPAPRRARRLRPSLPLADQRARARRRRT